MDKYEFNIKVEQIKKMAKVGDYSGAMKTADEIDWRRVSSVNLLTLVSEIYEKNRDYAEAKEILLLAYEKAPIGKRLLYKLTMLALNEDNIPEAEAYYREFYDLAPDDSRQHILRYLILKAKGAPADQLISSLEQYNREELDERWMYELAELYHKAGRSEDCVAMCDRVMLMFGIGKYVDKAMDLKLNREGRPLNEYQQNLIDNRDKYEARLKDMEENPDKYDPDADAEAVEKPENYDQDNMVSEDTGEIYTAPAAVTGRGYESGYNTRQEAGPEKEQTGQPGDTSAERAVRPAEQSYAVLGTVSSGSMDQDPQEEADEIVKADLSAILGSAFAGGTAAGITAAAAGAYAGEEDEIKIDENLISIAKAARAEKPVHPHRSGYVFTEREPSAWHEEIPDRAMPGEAAAAAAAGTAAAGAAEAGSVLTRQESEVWPDEVPDRAASAVTAALGTEAGSIFTRQEPAVWPDEVPDRAASAVTAALGTEAGSIFTRQEPAVWPDEVPDRAASAVTAALGTEAGSIFTRQKPAVWPDEVQDNAASAGTAAAGSMQEEAAEVNGYTEAQGEEDEEMTIYTVNFIVERRKEEDGVNAAVRLLKLMHEHTGSHNQVAKIKAGKLNTLGVLASRAKLAGKDLVVEQAGDLAYSTIEEIMELIKTEPTERVIVFIDNPMQIRKILSAYPELLQLFHVDKEEDTLVQEPEEEVPVTEAVPEQVKTAAYAPAYQDDYYEEEQAAAPEPIRTPAGGMTDTLSERAAQGRMDEEMDIDEFANYAQEYAESIDCSISGKSKLALYERIELMEEEGTRLTRETAVALIEEAADKAEKKSLGSLFKAKYDKDDKLILREENFVG